MRTSHFLALSVLAIMLGATVTRATASPSQAGPTGGLTIPDPMTLEPERTEVAVTAESFDQLTSNLDVKTSFDFSTKVNAGVYHNLELGVEKTFREKTTFRDQPYWFSGKMRFPVDTFNVAVGLLAPISGPDATSVYTVAGWKSIWGGFGINFGGKKFRQLTQTQLINAGVAKFGGFSLIRGTTPGLNGATFTGEVDTFFGLIGFNYRVSRNMAILGDFDGDRFAGGFRFNIKELVLDAAYVGQKEIDTLFSRNTQNVMVTVSHRF
ncbi:MAG: hypothetical protein HY303_08545 [Candidatus Wallbacteria bacterium]|nr:hypothetical protein [Candidatus Wallbacteria bacterium]